MPRLAQVDELLDLLKGINLDILGQLPIGENEGELERILETEIEEAESAAEAYTGRNLTPYAQVIDVISGHDTRSLMLREIPVISIDQVTIVIDPNLLASRQYSEAQLRIDKSRGLVSMRQNALLMSAIPALLYWPAGDNNIQVAYRSGWASIGGNVGIPAIMDSGFSAIATITTDASFAYYTNPIPFCAYKAAAALDTRGAQVMLQNGVDVSSKWTMVSSRRLKCAIADYSSAAQYIFAFAPSAIGQAILKSAGACVLTRLGTHSSGRSAGGATRIAVPGFSEDYGAFQYEGHVKQWNQDFGRMLAPYRRACA